MYYVSLGEFGIKIRDNNQVSQHMEPCLFGIPPIPPLSNLCFCDTITQLTLCDNANGNISQGVPRTALWILIDWYFRSLLIYS